MGAPEFVANLEFARHKAWRVAGQMKYITDKAKFGMKGEELAALFRKAANELLSAGRLLTYEANDLPGFIVNDKDKKTAEGKGRGDEDRRLRPSKL
mmetsp:Transcript_32395/g.63316  ORF Transcript_32395/g.63316 Transcript_32395/m.63316 type:complete len:96 (+) Transcript_32395:3-290(+)